jgi:MFS family permease
MDKTTITPSTSGGFTLSRTFTALKYRNYRLWFVGQVVSLMGTWMQVTAQGYLVYELTKSPAYLGYVGFASGIPTWLFTLYGGVIADRVPRRTLLVITQTSMMILAFILGSLAFMGVVRPWQIIVMAFALGVANAFDAPARLAFVPELVERKDLTNAIALNAIMFNTATAVGPAAAGITYALFGPGWCFTLNGISFIAIIAALLAMKLPHFIPPERRNSTIIELKEGFSYVLANPTILTIIIMIGVVSLFGLSFSNLFPAWAVEVLHGDAATNGLLRSALGIGSLLGGFTLASLSHIRSKGKLLTAGSFTFPLFMFIFCAMRWVPAALGLLACMGYASILVVNLANVLVQNQVSDALRGRVMGIYTLVFFGVMPLGALLAGSLADLITEPVTGFLSAAVLLVTAAVLYLFVPSLRALE